MKSSYSDNGRYPQFCQEAAENTEVFQSFRSKRDYRLIVETCGPNQGLNYQRLIEKQNPQLLDYLDRFATSDQIGEPVLNEYTFADRSYFLSPTTLRYISVLADLTAFFGCLDDLRIVEIGGGYGGQCKLIMDLFSPSAYTIVDLAPALALSQRFLSEFEIDWVHLKTSNDISGKALDCDLVISNYAFTEVNGQLQELYWNSVVSHAKKGYMLCNFTTHTWDSTQLSEQQLISRIGNVDCLKTAPPLSQSDQVAGVSLLWWDN